MTAIIEDAKELAIEKWGTLNTAMSPNKLPEGHSPDNQNVWMDEKPGSLVTSNGYTKLGELPSGLSPTLLLNYFKTSDGSQLLICSDGQTVWKTTNYVTFTSIQTGLSPYFQLRGVVVRDKVWLTNGSDPVMTYDGTTLTVLNGTGGTPNVPLGKYIAYHDERVWLYGISGSPSKLYFSELTDSAGTEIAPDNSSAWPVSNNLQISEGDADIGTALFLYRGYLYASKAFSIWRISGYDVYTYARVKTRASTGTRFAESIQIVDNLVHFIGADGLYTFDGEEAQRISDLIDPSSTEEGIFSFRSLQQNLLNNTFWNLSDTADFDAGTVPGTLSTASNALSLVPADDSEADFTAGTKTRVSATDNSGYLQLSRVTTGSAGTLISTGKTGALSGGSGNVGIASYLTDGNDSNQVGFFIGNANGQSVAWSVDLGAAYAIGRIILKNYTFERPDSPPVFSTFAIEASSDNSSWTTIAAVANPSYATRSSGGTFYSGSEYYTGPSSITTDFTTASYRYWRLHQVENGGSSGAYMVMTEMEVYQAGYEADGKFVSTSVDFGTTPSTFGTIAASIVTNSETYQFFTQSSNDNSTWDAEVNLSNGAAIGSALKRYLRWGAYLYSSTGVSTPVIDKVYLGGTYLSNIHNTGGNIYQWGAFQASSNKAGQTITYYYRAATTEVLVGSAAWVAIVPGAVPAAAVTDVFIQLKAELSTTDSTMDPYVDSMTVNWIVATGSGVNTLQNVASFVWNNRYWLSAATIGADQNDIIIVRGKSTFGSPFHKKDFAILSFCRFQDTFIAGASDGPSIYRMEYGYSKNGSAMDSYFETADFSDHDFIQKVKEIIVNLDRSGPYNLSVGYSTDGGLTWTDTTIDLTRISGQNLSFTKKLNISIMQDKFRFRFRINAADQPFSIDSARVYYRITPSRGSLN